MNSAFKAGAYRDHHFAALNFYMFDFEDILTYAKTHLSTPETRKCLEQQLTKTFANVYIKALQESDRSSVVIGEKIKRHYPILYDLGISSFIRFLSTGINIKNLLVEDSFIKEEAEILENIKNDFSKELMLILDNKKDPEFSSAKEMLYHYSLYYLPDPNEDLVDDNYYTGKSVFDEKYNAANISKNTISMNDILDTNQSPFGDKNQFIRNNTSDVSNESPFGDKNRALNLDRQEILPENFSKLG